MENEKDQIKQKCNSLCKRSFLTADTEESVMRMGRMKIRETIFCTRRSEVLIGVMPSSGCRGFPLAMDNMMHYQG